MLLEDWAGARLRRSLDKRRRAEDKLLATQATTAQMITGGCPPAPPGFNFVPPPPHFLSLSLFFFGVVAELAAAEEAVARSLLERQEELKRGRRRLRELEEEVERAREAGATLQATNKYPFWQKSHKTPQNPNRIPPPRHPRATMGPPLVFSPPPPHTFYPPGILVALISPPQPDNFIILSFHNFIILSFSAFFSTPWHPERDDAFPWARRLLPPPSPPSHASRGANYTPHHPPKPVIYLPNPVQGVNPTETSAEIPQNFLVLPQISLTPPRWLSSA